MTLRFPVAPMKASLGTGSSAGQQAIEGQPGSAQAGPASPLPSQASVQQPGQAPFSQAPPAGQPNAGDLR